MKTIFELVKIITNSKSRYPIRKTQKRVIGFFSTLAKAEKQIHKDAKICQAWEQKLLKHIAEEEVYRNDEKLCGHDIVLAYKITERELDEEHDENIQSVRTYTADGQPNDECLLDYKCERRFEGRPPEQIRFRPGDIVEVINEWQAELCVVAHAQPTKDDYKGFCKHCLERHEEIMFHWDYSDDSYLVESLGEGDTHFHPQSPFVFHPTKSISKALKDKFKAKYEEILARYDKH